MDNIKTLKSDILERLEASHKEALRICESIMQAEREKIIKELDDRSAVLTEYPKLHEFDRIIKWDFRGHNNDIHLSGYIESEKPVNQEFLPDGEWSIIILAKKVK